MSSLVSNEAMQWCEQGCDEPEMRARCSGQDAWTLTTWVHNCGGEARYDSNYLPAQPEIAVRTRSGWAACAPGQWVVKGDAWLHSNGSVCLLPTADVGTLVREFTVENR